MSYANEYGYAQRPGGPNLRLIGALIIAVIGVAMYLFETQTNPVTGKKQHIAMTVDQEKALGLQAAPEMAAKMGGAIDPDADPRAGWSTRSAAGSSARATPAAARTSATTTSTS